MLEKEISKIFKERSISFEEMIFDYETFEEPPLINFFLDTRKHFEQYICQEDFNTILFNLAFCHLNNIKLYAKKNLSKKSFDDFFICLTVTTPQDVVDEFGFCMPNFFVTRKKALMNSLKKVPQINFDNYPYFKEILKNLGVEDSVIVLNEEWFDKACNKNLQRFFFIFKDDFDDL